MSIKIWINKDLKKTPSLEYIFPGLFGIVGPPADCFLSLPCLSFILDHFFCMIPFISGIYIHMLVLGILSLIRLCSSLDLTGQEASAVLHIFYQTQKNSYHSHLLDKQINSARIRKL